MITKLHIQNFKCLRDVSVDLSPFTVLIGKNDTGKSSLLEAVQMLGELVASPPKVSRLPIEKLAWRGGGTRSITWGVEVDKTSRNNLPGPARYELQVSPAAAVYGGIFINSESLGMPHASAQYQSGASHRTVRLIEDGPAVQLKADNSSPTAVSMAGSTQGYPKIKAFAEALATSAIYRLDPERLAEPAAYLLDSSDPEAAPELSWDGSGLALVLDYILGSDRAALGANPGSARRRPCEILGVSRGSGDPIEVTGAHFLALIPPCGHDPAASAG